MIFQRNGLLPGLAALVILTGACSRIIPPQNGCPPGTYERQLVSGGQVRQYRLHVPPGYRAGTPAPLVFGFHGARSTAAWFEEASGLSRLADEAGFIAVYPQAAGPWAGWENWEGSTDVQFVRDLLDELGTRCDLDPARLYATGHSRGGGLADRLGCDLADRIAAIAPVAGTYQFSADCSPSRPVPVIAFHGSDDSQVPYSGFSNPGMPPEAYYTIGVPIPQWASSWAGRNGCSLPSSTVYERGPLTGQGWGNCRAGADVLLYTIHGGGHEWPGELGNFDAARMIWDFFVRHPLDDPR